MDSRAQVAETLARIFNEEAEELARASGFIKRRRTLSGADFAQGLVFGWWQEPAISLDGLTQVLQRREVDMSAPGLRQRFTPRAATFLETLLERLTQEQLQTEAVPIALLRQFTAVVIEDSASIVLPDVLASVWQGCGGSAGMSQAAVKLFARWDGLRGRLEGPCLPEGRRNDHRRPFDLEREPSGCLYVADLGFFGWDRFCRICRRSGKRKKAHKWAKRYFLSRWFSRARLWDRHGQRIELRDHLPQQVGQRRELEAVLGQRERLAVRVLIERVPKEVAQEPRQHIQEAAQAHGRQPEEETLFLADWTIVITNVARRLLSFEQVLVVLRLRWQIERLFRLCKEHGQIDEWRSKQPWRILCELYANLCAMVLPQWFIQRGCWQDAHRSLVKAAQVCRREAGRVMVALYAVGLPLEHAQDLSQHLPVLARHAAGLAQASSRQEGQRLNLMSMGPLRSPPDEMWPYELRR